MTVPDRPTPPVPAGPSSLTDPADPRLVDVDLAGDVRDQEWWRRLVTPPPEPGP